jgi:pimeloyl-ACP methyl ester carboxylesterase
MGLKIRQLLLFIFFCQLAVAQTHFIKSFDGTRIAYSDEGKGTPILLLHGFINTRFSWDQTELKRELLKKGYRLIIPDLRGNGESDKPHDENAFANDAEVRDMMLLIDALKIRKYWAIGYSRGSIVLAKLLTGDHRIRKAVLGGMGLDFTDPKWDRRRMFADAFAGKTTVGTEGAVNYAKSIGADLKCLYLQQKYQPVTSAGALSKIRAKILVIAGDRDTDNGNPSELQGAIPKSKLKIVSGDHNATYKTAAFAAAIISFLK